jgi:hypothetical protein
MNHEIRWNQASTARVMLLSGRQAADCVASPVAGFRSRMQ